MRSQALPVDNFTIQVKACELSSVFCAKGKTAQNSAAQRFMKKGCIYCIATHIDPQEIVADATDFMKIHHALPDKLVRDKRQGNVC